MLLAKKVLVLENETQLRKQEKPPPERESVQLHQEKVLEGELQDELQEDEDVKPSPLFLLHLIRTVNS